MPNQSPEQDLIHGFVEAIDEICNLNNLTLRKHNTSCWSRSYADIEFTLSSEQSEQCWAIEAKSNESSDNHNTVHKLFGELLKETGRNRGTNCNFAILIPKNGIDFYHKRFRKIDRCKFFGFGWLIPIRTIFFYDHNSNSVEYTSWEQFYDNKSNNCSSGFPV